jgi:hypothetical protein
MADLTLNKPHATTTVTKHTRAPKAGRVMRCPLCFSHVKVYHFSWSALVCPSCKISIPKLVWEIDK